MTPTIFLSLSFTDEKFVRAVYDRLPRGIARYYQRSFERGEDLIKAMERNLEASEIFVLFASRDSLKSFAVNFEIDEARTLTIFGRMKRVYVFPIERGLTFADLPTWLRRSWQPNAGETPSDIARFLTTVLLEPDRGLSVAAPKVVGRGATADSVRRIVAAHLQRRRVSPNVFIFPGISGIGRRTFAAYFLRQGLDAEANLPYGPSIQLSAQAELVDLYRAMRVEIDPTIQPQAIAADQTAFQNLDQEQQISEIIRVLGHFTTLGQAVIIYTAAGLFEDVATPKAWVSRLLMSVPRQQYVIVISNLQFRDEFIENLGNAIQVRISELGDDDIRTLMIFSADIMGVEDFQVSDRLVHAIGGHPDVANAAVRLAKQRGTSLLEKDPSQLFSVQQSIIGDLVRPEALDGVGKKILDVLGWLPTLGSDLLEEIVVDELAVDQSCFNSTVEHLVLSCLIYANGPRLAIANSVRHIYRRYNIADDQTIEAMAKVFKRAWAKAQSQGFRDDLFSAFVFMHMLDGSSLPDELKALLTPSNLYDVIREVYARGKQTEDDAVIQQSIQWGSLAFDMKMGEGLREEILSTVARAQIRLRYYSDAKKTIEVMQQKNYRQVTFLEGHLLRKQQRFEQAIPKLRLALEKNRGNRAAVHELALCYRRLHRVRELESLLRDNVHLIDDSAQFLDFMIGLHIARNELATVPRAIERLRRLDDNSNRADLRHAQLLARQRGERAACDYLTDILGGMRGSLRLRKARAVYAANIGRVNVARDDLSIIRAGQKGDGTATGIETQILLAEGRRKEAYELSKTVTPKEPGDWLLRAAVYESYADDPDVGLSDRADLKQRAIEIRAQFHQIPNFDYED